MVDNLEIETPGPFPSGIRNIMPHLLNDANWLKKKFKKDEQHRQQGHISKGLPHPGVAKPPGQQASDLIADRTAD